MLKDECQRLLQQFLQSSPESAAWMRGPWCAERQKAYEIGLTYVLQRMRERTDWPDDWRGQLQRQGQVIQEVRKLLDPNSETEIP